MRVSLCTSQAFRKLGSSRISFSPDLPAAKSDRDQQEEGRKGVYLADMDLLVDPFGKSAGCDSGDLRKSSSPGEPNGPRSHDGTFRDLRDHRKFLVS